MFTNPFATGSPAPSQSSILASTASTVLQPLASRTSPSYSMPNSSGRRRSSLNRSGANGPLDPINSTSSLASGPDLTPSTSTRTSASAVSHYPASNGVTFVSSFAASLRPSPNAGSPTEGALRDSTRRSGSVSDRGTGIAVAGSSSATTSDAFLDASRAGDSPSFAARERKSFSVSPRKGSVIGTGSSTCTRSASRAGSGDFSVLLANNSQSSPGSRRASLGGTPLPLRSPAVTTAQVQPFFSSFVDSTSPAAPAADTPSGFASRQLVDFTRRRSVDVGVLGMGTHRQGSGAPSRRIREAVGPDAGDKEYGLIGAGAKGGKDRLLGRHLASLLAHSLSLCSEQPAPPSEILHLDLSYDEDHILKTLPVIIGFPETSPSASRHTSVSTGSISFSAAGSSLSDPVDEPTFTPTVAPLRPIPLSANSFPVISEAKRSKLIANLQSWSFNAMGHSSDDLLSCVGIIFEGVRNIEGVDFDLTQFRSLLMLLRSAYHSRNGYHNFSHATDVTQACYSFLVRMGLSPPLYLLCEDDYDRNLGEGRRKWRRNRAVEESGMGELLRPMDVFGIMVAAIGHDVGHPGLSNAYMINACTPVSQIYDRSVLENFHTVTLIHMLRKSGFGHLLGGEFGHLGENATEFRKVLEASILATDMSRHFSFVNEINELGRRFGDRRSASTGSIESDRLLLCSGLMKCADISNPTRPHRISRAWSTALLDEWSVQAAIERQYGLPISVMTIDHTDTKAQAKSQVGFIDLFAKPLFDAMARVVDEFADFAEKLRDGRIAWEAISLQGDEAFRQAPLARDPEQTSSREYVASPERSSSPVGVDEDSPATPRLNSQASAPFQSSPSSTIKTPGSFRGESLPSSARSLSYRSRPLPIRPEHTMRHSRHPSGGSSSSTNASPLSPLFPASVSSNATTMSIAASSPSEYASPFTGARSFPPSQLANDFNADLKATCGGACTTATAMCEACARKIEDASVRRGSLGRALAGIEQREAEELELAEYDDEEEFDVTDLAVWPPYPFMPTRAPALSPVPPRTNQ